MNNSEVIGTPKTSKKAHVVLNRDAPIIAELLQPLITKLNKQGGVDKFFSDKWGDYNIIVREIENSFPRGWSIDSVCQNCFSIRYKEI